MAVKVVTDSTCDLPKELAQQSDITVIPCSVIFGDEEYKDGLDIGPDEFYRRLVSSPQLPTTAQPSVGNFLQVYQTLCDQGYEVVSIHLSAELSGTLNSATQARETLLSATTGGTGTPKRVEIIDSRMASLGLGLLALEAAQMAKTGSSCDQVVEGVKGCLPKTHCYFLLDTLEYLQKGGRIGKAAAFLGSILKIKPLLMMKDGEAHPVERVRTWERGLQRLEETINGLGPAKRLGILHSTTPEVAEVLHGRLKDIVSEGEPIMSRFGPAIGTYLGPGALGVTLISG